MESHGTPELRIVKLVALIRGIDFIATMHSSHKADDDLPHGSNGLELR